MTANKMPEMPEAVAFVVVCADGSISDRIAPTGWHTFENELANLQKDPWVRIGKAEIAPLYTADQMRAMWLAGVSYSDKIIERLRRDMQTINDDCDGDNHLNVSCDALDAIGAYRNNLTALEQEAKK